MSRRQGPPDPVRAAEEKVPCTFCGAGVGQRCVQQNGKTYPYSHADRFHAATRAGHLPLKAGAS